MPQLTEFGAIPVGSHGFGLRVWAPEAEWIDVVLEADDQHTEQTLTMTTCPDGTHELQHPILSAGRRYRYRVQTGMPFPDPCSRFQPQGVHGPSQIVDPRPFPWTDQAWTGRSLRELVVYELHVGTFSPEGTFAGVANRLNYLKDLGVTAIELMPVGDFPGRWNWGYDLVSMYAPARCYGSPDDLRRLVDMAHRLGLAVLLDVVYNHLGPDGNYQGVYSPYYNSKIHTNPWGASFNFDGPYSKMVRETYIQNAIYWLRDFHFDGLRLDATHAIIDDSEQHFLAELTARARAAVPDREVVIIAEECRNLAHMLKPGHEGGWGLDATWADDFHHSMRRLLAGDHEGYYMDFEGTTSELTTALNQGWLYTGQYSKHSDGPRGTDPSGLPPERFVLCIQNHDQIGNRAMGERLHHQIDLAAYRAASTVLLLAPHTPLLFMGQEWAATAPFQYFTDHKPDLGALVTEGRRKEFKDFEAFHSPAARERIPDPQAESTFTRCKLHWPELDHPDHAATLRLYQQLLQLRQSDDFRAEPIRTHAQALTAQTVLLLRETRRAVFAIVACLKESDSVDLEPACHGFLGEEKRAWTLAFTTEEKDVADDPQPITVSMAADAYRVQFTRPGAVALVICEQTIKN